MREIICIAAGFIAGGFMGVVAMSMLQIHRINQYEQKIMKLKKQLEKNNQGARQEMKTTEFFIFMLLDCELILSAVADRNLLKGGEAI